MGAIDLISAETLSGGVEINIKHGWSRELAEQAAGMAEWSNYVDKGQLGAPDIECSGRISTQSPAVKMKNQAKSGF